MADGRHLEKSKNGHISTTVRPAWCIGLLAQKTPIGSWS